MAQKADIVRLVCSRRLVLKKTARLDDDIVLSIGSERIDANLDHSRRDPFGIKIIYFETAIADEVCGRQGQHLEQGTNRDANRQRCMGLMPHESDPNRSPRPRSKTEMPLTRGPTPFISPKFKRGSQRYLHVYFCG